MKKIAFCFFVSQLIFICANAQEASIYSGTPAGALKRGFLSPPHSAKPVTWWHWTGSNVTKEGITKDLEWMKRVGIGGFQAIDVSFGSGQTTDKKIVFFTPEWFDAIRHAATEADRLGLDMTMVTSAGWSETGGPWVKPEEAVKKPVWSETQVTGGKKFSGSLPQPPAVTGPIRNMKRREGGLGGTTSPEVTFYADQAVLAYRTPAEESNQENLRPVITSSFGAIDSAAALLDDDLSTNISLPVPKQDKPTWIQYEFAQPFKARAFSVALAQTGTFGSSSMRPGYVQVSSDGKTFKTILSLPGAQHDIRALPVRTFSFPQIAARFYRVVFTTGSGITTVGGPDQAGGFMGPATPPTHFDLTEAIFHSGGRVNRWEDKAHYAPMFEFETLATPSVPASAAILQESIIDLTSKMSKDGTLDWQVPAGNWTILRMGYSLTGAKNGPAVPAGTGFEVDKLSRKHLESYYRNYVDPIAKAMGPLFGKSMKYWLIDSYEADAQNWTEEMIPEFRKRRGYDPTPYLPVLAGRIVQSAEVSDRFLWDFRRTIADLLAENHYAVLTELANKQGLKTYSEAAGISLPVLQDALMNKGRVDIPMGEFGMSRGLGSGAAWTPPAELEVQGTYRGAAERMNAHQADVREAAAAGHVYGKNIVAAESWTGGGYEAPASMKLIGDYWYTQGINQVIFHTSAHQPLDTKPGNTMVGTHIHRNITWAEQAQPFMNYLSRNQYLLQQGRFVADIVYYLGESIPSAVPYWERLQPEPPAGYDYDFINTEILLDSMTVKDGKLVLPNGMNYHTLVLPQTNQMTPRVLQKIRNLVAAGAIVVGPKPKQSPSLAGYPDVDTEVALLATEIWGDADGRLVFQHGYGKGTVYWGVPLMGILAEKGVAKDVDYTRPHTDTYLSWIHRRTSDADVYFISNLRDQAEDVQIQFRVNGKIPELWHSDKGTIGQVSYKIEDSLTSVSLHLEPQESVFIVFHNSATATSGQAPAVERKVIAALTGPWKVTFASNLGAPESIRLDSLVSWTEHRDSGVKYFSGTATYTKTVQADKSWFGKERKFVLHLGKVKDIAEVSLNGKPLDTLWKAPYSVDITNVLKPGTNSLEIKVTNQWTNRIVGDRSLPDAKKILTGAGGGFGRPTTVQESGLLGPVTINSVLMK